MEAVSFLDGTSVTCLCQHPTCTAKAVVPSAFCRRHGGGQRCAHSNCKKAAAVPTRYCIRHGGGKRCEFMGCRSGAVASTPFCIAHGGGRRCEHPGCRRSSQGPTRLCIRHGGGRRCSVEECTRTAASKGLCRMHGGGRRCEYKNGCETAACGGHGLCKRHFNGMMKDLQADAEHKAAGDRYHRDHHQHHEASAVLQEMLKCESQENPLQFQTPQPHQSPLMMVPSMLQGGSQHLLLSQGPLWGEVAFGMDAGSSLMGQRSSSANSNFQSRLPSMPRLDSREFQTISAPPTTPGITTHTGHVEQALSPHTWPGGSTSHFERQYFQFPYGIMQL